MQFSAADTLFQQIFCSFRFSSSTQRC